jgi:hypothetical protein
MVYEILCIYIYVTSRLYKIGVYKIRLRSFNIPFGFAAYVCHMSNQMMTNLDKHILYSLKIYRFKYNTIFCLKYTIQSITKLR